MDYEAVSPDGRFGIHWHRSSRGSYFEMEDFDEYIVQNIHTMLEVKTWRGSTYASADRREETGVDSVRFSEDGTCAIATFHGGLPEERFPLPPIDDAERKATARCPELTFCGGRCRVVWRIVRETATETEFEIVATEMKEGREVVRATFSRIETRGIDGKISVKGIRKVYFTPNGTGIGEEESEALHQHGF